MKRETARESATVTPDFKGALGVLPAVDKEEEEKEEEEKEARVSLVPPVVGGRVSRSWQRMEAVAPGKWVCEAARSSNTPALSPGSEARRALRSGDARRSLMVAGSSRALGVVRAARRPLQACRLKDREGEEEEEDSKPPAPGPMLACTALATAI